MMHNTLINYNCVDSLMDSLMDSVIDSARMEDHNMLLEIIKEKIKEQEETLFGVPKRDRYIDKAERRRPGSMNDLKTQKMSVMFSSSDFVNHFVHHFILYRMDDGRIADVYIKLTADKNVDVFEYSVVQT